MSDKEEATASKRPHESDDKPVEDDESSDGWIGPLPTDAAPVKRRKGFIYFEISNKNATQFQTILIDTI